MKKPSILLDVALMYEKTYTERGEVFRFRDDEEIEEEDGEDCPSLTFSLGRLAPGNSQHEVYRLYCLKTEALPNPNINANSRNWWAYQDIQKPHWALYGSYYNADDAYKAYDECVKHIGEELKITRLDEILEEDDERQRLAN